MTRESPGAEGEDGDFESFWMKRFPPTTGAPRRDGPSPVIGGSMSRARGMCAPASCHRRRCEPGLKVTLPPTPGSRAADLLTARPPAPGQSAATSLQPP
ncbi:hypothetical protein SKAU_G00130250 [Synaphobranchus kaupii]|uniref:Uncharacterized protein n=1 Tax=Synaphobranchus kaupii TaxID=118154 RepID=A0A9Q1FQH0_SYNKA|nr:hypothetical protein SKAU_G00130250 [Synaphobranchus kaupii]